MTTEQVAKTPVACDHGEIQVLPRGRIFCPKCRQYGEITPTTPPTTDPVAAFLESLRSPRNSLGKLALPKGLMELAVEKAYDAEGVVTFVGDPGDGLTATHLDELAEAIVDALTEALRSRKPDPSFYGEEMDGYNMTPREQP